MSDEIRYNYPVEELDRLIEQISEGRTPLMTPELKQEVNLRYHQRMNELFGDDDDDEAFQSEVQKHKEVMQKIEEQRRSSHSRNIVILDLTDEEKEELYSGMESSYVRSDPNSSYNLSDEDISEDEEKRRIYKQLQSIGKIYYHQEDYRAAIEIIQHAIEYSLRHDYPWLTYEEALEEFRQGRIRYTFSQLPLLYINWNTQISDPEILKGIVTGDVTLIDKDTEPVKKKKQKANPVQMDYSIITPAEHAEYVKVHQAGFNTPISAILKSCSTIYNRYVMPKASSWFGNATSDQLPDIDWTQPGAGEAYYNAKYGIKTNTVSDLIGFLNAQNGRTLNHVLGNSVRDFIQGINGETETPQFRTLSTTLESNEHAVEIESHIMDMIRQSNPNL